MRTELAEARSGQAEVGDTLGATQDDLARAEARVSELEQALARALETEALDFAAEDLRLALRALDRITGKVDVEALLDVIFRDFCIGK